MVTIVGFTGAVKNVQHVIKGFKKHGDVYHLLSDSLDPIAKSADMFLQKNLIKPKYELISDKYNFILNSNKPFLVQESPSFRQYGRHFRLGWWSYKWEDADCGNENSPPDRWNKFVQETGIRIKPWKSQGDKILIMGQKEGDSSLQNLYQQGYESFYDWVEEIIITIRKYSDREIVLRPHPRNLRRGHKLATRLSKKLNSKITVSENVQIYNEPGGGRGGDGLLNDLKDAYCVVTYNSLSGVESVTEGIPTFAIENGSMVWPIANKDISKIENLNYDIDITQWCNDIAYTQWSKEECGQGLAWAHLKPIIFKD